MMRFLSILALSALSWAASSAVSACQVPGAKVPQGDELRAEILGTPVAKLEPAELAGTASGTKPAVLALEQAYSLALIRARSPGASIGLSPGDRFDSKVLDEQARRAGAGDFDRFRGEFLSSGFRDPASGFFAALKYRHAVDSARDQVALAESTRRIFDKLLQSQTSGVSQLQIDQVDHYLLLARQNLAIDLVRYRSAVDQLKVSLGLPVSTPIVLDERILDPFRSTFAAIDRWQRNPNRQLNELPAIYNGLPRLEDLKIGGGSLVEAARETLPEQAFLDTCVELAGKHRAVLKDDHAAARGRNALELRIREQARGLILLHKNYETARRGQELSLREADQWFEQLIAPPLGGGSPLARSINVSVQITRVLEAQSRLYRGRSDFESQWLEFKEKSLAFYRELGIMPYDTWESFYRSFQPTAGRPQAEAEPPKPNTPGPDSPATPLRQ
jgi:hypothetical protein